MKLIVGLGNPGSKYAFNRHNVGFILIDLLVQELGASLKEDKKFKAELAKSKKLSEDIVLVKPMTYMNLSGSAVNKVASYFKIKPSNIIVFYDDIDMEKGKVRFRANGGHGGHNGVRSLIQELGSDEFSRVKVGVGRPSSESKQSVSSWVLDDFVEQDLSELKETIFPQTLLKLDKFLNN
ncbi:MAG: aminoacyl-tRNA hydrolase [Zetaproteobacteria bacterium]|nr:aminoacyl-tRNA hydrolase [Pseudobdellovibrionaceae bacterium]